MAIRALQGKSRPRRVLHRRPPQTPEGGPNPGGTTEGAPKGGREQAPPPGEPQSGTPRVKAKGGGGAQGGPTRPGEGPHTGDPKPSREGAPQATLPQRREKKGEQKRNIKVRT